MPKFPNRRHEPGDWGKWVEVKVNAPQLIRKERTQVFGSKIFFSSATDPYQYIELKYRLSRQCLTELLKYNPGSIMMHTRSHLMLQDLELLRAFGDRLSVGVSITTDNDRVREEFEPKAPSLRRRLELIRKLTDAGIAVHASLSPLLPCDPERLASLLSPYVSHLWVDAMHWPEVNTRPHLLEKYRDFFAEESYNETISIIRAKFKRRRSEKVVDSTALSTREAARLAVRQLRLPIG